jgi:hypothetical protein
MYNKESLESELSAQAGAEGRAPRIDLADFSTAITTGVLRALDARSVAESSQLQAVELRRPWIWAGFILGPEGPGGPIGPGGPEGPGGPIAFDGPGGPGTSGPGSAGG